MRINDTHMKKKDSVKAVVNEKKTLASSNINELRRLADAYKVIFVSGNHIVIPLFFTF